MDLEFTVIVVAGWKNLENLCREVCFQSKDLSFGPWSIKCTKKSYLFVLPPVIITSGCLCSSYLLQVSIVLIVR